MLDWLGSIEIRTRSATRIELALTRGTTWSGWAFAGGGAGLCALGLLWATILGGFLFAVGVLFGTLRRTLVFDRDDGLLRCEQRILGVRRRAAIPLFHLRSVVVAAKRGGIYVAYVERRAGGAIHLDEARRSAPLLKLCEQIAEVSELRLVYDATPRVAADQS